MLHRFWQGVQSMLGESPASLAAPVPLPLCDLAVTESERVLELLRLKAVKDRGLGVPRSLP